MSVLSRHLGRVPEQGEVQAFGTVIITDKPFRRVLMYCWRGEPIMRATIKRTGDAIFSYTNMEVTDDQHSPEFAGNPCKVMQSDRAPYIHSALECIKGTKVEQGDLEGAMAFLKRFAARQSDWPEGELWSYFLDGICFLKLACTTGIEVIEWEEGDTWATLEQTDAIHKAAEDHATKVCS